MPQTVPSAGLSPPPLSSTSSTTTGGPCPAAYSFTAESFDLSLLSPPPQPDGEVPVSPPSLRHLMTLFGDHAEPMFISSSATANDAGLLRGGGEDDYPTTLLDDDIHQIKSQQQQQQQLQEQQQQQQLQYNPIFEQFHNFGYQSPVYPTPSPSSASDEASLPTFNIQPCSPYDQTNNLYGQGYNSGGFLSVVKEEPNLLSPQYAGSSPYSPASTCTSYSNNASPHYAPPLSPQHYSQRQIKDETAIDIEEFLKENQILQDQVYQQQQELLPKQEASEVQQLLVPKQEVSPTVTKPKDYQLLREVLQDTSFQKRFNLRPINFDSLTAASTAAVVKMEEGTEGGNGDNLMTSCSSALAREKIEPVLNMAIEQMRKDVDNTCTALGISHDPLLWSNEDVKAWLLWTLRQYSLPLVPVEYFSMDGARLAALSEQDFIQRAPQAGSTLYAQLEIWKAARQENPGMPSSSGWSSPSAHASTSAQSSNEEGSEDEEDDSSKLPSPTPGGGKAPSSKQGGGSHIHLWQFLKELLASPQLHGSAIRWLDRSKGVFKIEDSVRVARLWGKRKNRPAMNYDKLSRSIRQYYKKGIMKKTERSQRLVYQFCHPYCL